MYLAGLPDLISDTPSGGSTDPEADIGSADPEGEDPVTPRGDSTDPKATLNLAETEGGDTDTSTNGSTDPKAQTSSADPVGENSEYRDRVTSDEGYRRVIIVGNDVVSLFPNLMEENTGRIAGEKVLESEMIVEGADYMEIARYVSGNRDLCGDLSEVERVLPWRRKKGRRHIAGMQNIEMKGKKKHLSNTWAFPAATPTEREKRVLLQKMTEIGVRVIFRNFVYSFGGELFLQSEGGPIGARVTMACARLVMDDWATKYRGILERSGIEVRVMKGYVDDGRQISELIIRGTRYVKELKRFLWRKDWEDIDNMENKPDEVRIAEICLPAMNAVNPNLKFTVETAHDFPDQRLATLDFAVEEVRGIIHYTYFQKSMKTPLVLMAKSAMGEQQKYSIMTNELIRRMSNVRGNTGQNEKNRVINQYTKQLKNSG